MPRRLDSVNQGGFVEAIDVDESELEAVVGMLGFSDAQKSETARDQIYRALEFFQTTRSHSIKAKTIREDRGDLNKLAEAINPETMTTRLEAAVAALESLQTENPVLFELTCPPVSSAFYVRPTVAADGSPIVFGMDDHRTASGAGGRYPRALCGRNVLYSCRHRSIKTFASPSV